MCGFDLKVLEAGSHNRQVGGDLGARPFLGWLSSLDGCPALVGATTAADLTPNSEAPKPSASTTWSALASCHVLAICHALTSCHKLIYCLFLYGLSRLYPLSGLY